MKRNGCHIEEDGMVNPEYRMSLGRCWVCELADRETVVWEGSIGELYELLGPFRLARQEIRQMSKDPSGATSTAHFCARCSVWWLVSAAHKAIYVGGLRHRDKGLLV